MLGAALGLVAAPVQAMTLVEALVRTYETNPVILAARAGLRATDEEVAQAKQSWWRPTIQGDAYAAYQKIHQSTTTSTDGETVFQPYRDALDEEGWSVSAQVPLFTGGTTLNNIRAAYADVDATTAALDETVQSTLASAATAFVDVILGEKLLQISQEQEESYVPLVQMSEAMYRDQTGTVTDLAQVQNEIASAKATVESARSDLEGYRASFEQIVGAPPDDLGDWPEIPVPIQSLDEALRIAMERSPQILAARYQIEEQGFEVQAAKGTLLPQVYATAAWQQTWDQSRILDGVLSRQTEVETELTAQVYLTWTFFNGGYSYSLVRQQRQLLQQARDQLRGVVRSVQASVRTYWAQRQAAEREIRFDEEGIKAAKIAMTGKQKEFRDGSTSMTEVILAQQTLYASIESLAEAEGSLLTANVNLLESVGRFDERSLGLPVTPYDPRRYLREVEDKWVGWGIE